MVHKKKIKSMSESQWKRFKEIQSRLWEIHAEETSMRGEIKAMGLTHDMYGHLEQEIKIRKGK